MARTFGPAVSEEYSSVVFFWGGGAVADAYPLVVEEPNPVVVSGLRVVVSDSDWSVLPVAGFEFPAVFWGRSPLIRLAWALARRVPEWIRRKLCRSEQTSEPLLARAAPGATPEMKLVTRSCIVGEGEYTNGIESIKYVPQLTASIWMPFEQSCDEESGDADFDKAAPWDDGETRRG